MIYLKVVYGHLPGGTEETRDHRSHSSSRDFKLQAPKYEAGALGDFRLYGSEL